MRIFTGHRGMVLSLAMSPDGRYMASGDEDGAIMMWDLGSGRCVTPLLGHSGCIWSLAFSGEGSLLASGSVDSTLRIWDVNGSSKPARIGDKSGWSYPAIKVIEDSADQKYSCLYIEVFKEESPTCSWCFQSLESFII
ncbi:hypothetical protein O6H91_Y102600 [Diphasiastrum complanatum]|nr:hypothetical protein O6H91_Y102600 [Diphasiastrum complanatum]